jgi:hypothetical protein
MPKTDYIDPNDDGFNAQQQTFKLNIASYSAVIGVTAAQIAGQSGDADYFDYTLKSMAVMANGAQQWTAWKNIERAGGTPPAMGAPVAPVFPAAVPAVAPGIEARFRALVQSIKTNANYNEAIGQALGIEGAQQTGPDLTTIQPAIDAVISGNHVNVKWGWGGNSAYLDICEIQVDRGDGKGFVLLAYDTTPGYTDTQPFPVSAIKWIYRAIYRVGDSQVGLWSLPVSVTVGA